MHQKCDVGVKVCDCLIKLQATNRNTPKAVLKSSVFGSFYSHLLLLDRAAKVSSAESNLSQQLCVKFRPERFRFVGIILEQSSSDEHNTCISRHKSIFAHVRIMVVPMTSYNNS